MQLGSLELQIFVALVLVLGSAFVALVCDFLKGNNEQLRERNIELRVREDERERLGLFQPLAHPINWLQGLVAMIRNPGMAEAMATGPVPAPSQAREESSARTSTAAGPAEQPDLGNLTGAASPSGSDSSEADRNPSRRHRYDEFKAAAKHQTWATKEELEQLAGRAARIRARHEASHRKVEDLVEGLGRTAESVAAIPPVPEVREAPRRPKVAELPRLEQAPPSLTVAPPPVAAEVLLSATVLESAPVEIAPASAPAPPPVESTITLPPIVDAAGPAPQDQAPPPMVESHAATAWTFRSAPEAPKFPEASTVAADLTPSIVRPGSPSLVSSLPIAMPVEPESAEVEAPVQFEATTAVGPEEIVEIWRRPADADDHIASFTGELPPLVETPAPEVPIAGPAPAEVLEIPEIPAVAVTPEPVRTRIQAVAVLPESEAVTEEIVLPEPVVPVQAVPLPPAALEPLRLPVTARPVENTMPALDVAALQKATGENRVTLTRSASGESSGENKLEIPAGLHESAVLSLLIENQAPYSGVVVAIGLNDYETLRDKLASGTDSVAALNKMVLSMLRPQDFACRFQDDEYILVYPGERGSSAQRRLFQVSEKLWDFQLRSLGNLSVMFSWGGLEVTNETLAEAVASARERMYQTKRNRKPSNIEFAVGRKKVVNG